MRKTLFLIIFLLPLTVFGQSLKLSDRAEISIITVGPGSDLSALFGHNAIRIIDPVWGFDKAYGYGSFDFDTPNFHLKFTMGKLLYEADAKDFDTFMIEYQYYKRWVYEQTLDLDSASKQQVYEFVQWNIKPENKKYKYDFFFDNCATKMRDILKNILGDKISFSGEYLTVTSSFRDLLRSKTRPMPWISMGMDVALGSRIDPNASAEEHMFLPDYILSSLDNASITENGVTKPIVKSARMVYDPQNGELQVGFFTPTIVFSFLALVVLGLTLRDVQNKRRSRILDFIVLLITGLLGGVVLFLWFGTDHDGMRNNLNILWAFLPNIYVAFLILKREPPKWVRSYIRLLFILLIMMVLVWIFGLQVYATSFIPILLLLGARYFFLWQKGLMRVQSNNS